MENYKNVSGVGPPLRRKLHGEGLIVQLGGYFGNLGEAII
jgi:hypothetical protein